MKKALITKLPVFVFLLLSALTTAYIVQKGMYSRVTSSAYTIPPAPIPVQPVLLDEHFDTPSVLSNWTLNQNNTTNKITISPNAYKGSGSLQFDYKDYSNNQFLRADRTISSGPVTNMVVKTAFYDDMSATKGVSFLITNQNNQSQNTALVINTNISPTKYLFRLNTYDQMLDSGIPRTLGWHILELIVTDKGTYAKIDNTFIYRADRTLMVNTTQKQFNLVSYIATWGLYGKSLFDEASVIQMDSLSATNNIFRVLQTFYNIYGNTDFSPIYSQLGTRTHANDLRALLNTSTAFYAYGKRVNNLTAVNRAKSLFSDALNRGNWNTDSDGKYWARGAYLAQLSGALNLLKPDLDASTIQKAKNILFSQIQTYILARDDFNTSPLSGWINSSTPVNINTAVITPGKGQNGSPGLVINYPDGTGNNLVSIKKMLPVYDSAPSLKATIWFYDDMSLKKGVMFLLASNANAQNTGIGVNTSISKDYYLFRINSVGNMQPTAIRRSAGWHKFSLSLSSNCCGLASEKIGVSGYIDGQYIGVNSTQLNSNMIQIVSTWGLTGTSIFDNLLITRMPDTGKTSDTKGEENGWHALVLAETTNYFPDVSNRSILADLAKCYAYHSITVSGDPGLCETKTSTAYNDFRFDNHNQLNPSYQSGVMFELIRGGISYQAINQAVPAEFTHHITDSFKTWVRYIDPNAYQYINSPLGDWTGVTNTPYQSGEPVIIYFSTRTTLPFSFSDYINKRFILFNGLVSNYVKSNPINIPTFDQNNRSDPGYIWWTDSIVAGEMLFLSGYPLL